MGSEPDCLQLTTTGRRSGLSRETEIWFIRHAGRVYLMAENGEGAAWVRNLRANPRVRWRIGDTSATGEGRVVDAPTEPALVDAVRARFVAKYGWGDGLAVELAASDRPDGRR